MDRKSAIVLTVCGLLFVVWYILTPKLFPPPPPAPTNQTATVIPGTNSGASFAPATNNAVSPSTTLTNFAQPTPSAPEETLLITNDLVRLTFTSHGGGLKKAELLQHRESVTRASRKTTSGARPFTLNGPATLPVLALAGNDALAGDGVYRISRFVPTPPADSTNLAGTGPWQGIRAEKLLGNGLFIVKEFSVGNDYLVHARVRFENRGPAEQVLPPQTWMVGAATPLNAQDDESLVGLTWFDTSDTQRNRPYFENRSFFGCLPGTPIPDYAETNVNVRWAAAKNQFFFIALMPEVPGISVMARQFDLPIPSREEIESDAKTMTNQVAFNVLLTQAGTNLTAGAALERNFHIYAGPKEFRRLERLAAVLNNEINRLMEFGFFSFIAGFLLMSMNGLHALGLSYALAIIAITVIIKLLFWPLTQASTRSMKRMQALQPQMKALQEKYKDDPTKMNRKLMEFMKENKVSPLGGCLPVLLQIPVFIGFFTMVRTAIELRGASFLWATDLSRPDTLFVIPLLNFNFNPLPLLMGVTMFWQARLTPPAPGMDPMQQKMMKYFPLAFLFILYNYSAGLTLYWTVQNILSIVQTKLTRISDQKKNAPGTKSAPGAPAATSLAPRRKR